MRVAEWLLARDFQEYINAYKHGEGSKYYEINNIADIDDEATRYLLKQTLDIGHGALRSEGKTEDNKYYYKAYYKMNDLNNNHILKMLQLDFNDIYDFSYSVDAKGFVKAINNHLSNDVEYNDDTDSVEQRLEDALEKIDRLEQSQATGSFSMGNPTVAHGEDKTYEQVVEALTTANDQIAKLKSQLEQSTTDKRSYTTPAMNVMDKVITKFWLDYNPNQSAPKQEIIVRWITGNFDGVSKALALNIDKVCRHSDAKKGGQYKK